MICKLQERSPLKYQLIRCVNCIVPKHIINDGEACTLKFNKIVHMIFERKHFTAKEADEAKLQFETFVEDTKNTEMSFCALTSLP